MVVNMKYYIVKMYHNSFKCKVSDNENITSLVNSFIKRQNKGETKSDRIYLKSINKISEKEYNDSILFDETYKL